MPSILSSFTPDGDAPTSLPSPLPPPSYPYRNSADSSQTTLDLGRNLSEKDWTTVNIHEDGLTNPPPPPPNPTAHKLLSQTFSRTSFALRVLSAIFSVGIVGLVGSAYSAFFATKSHRVIYAGQPVWPEDIDLTPSNAILIVGAITAATSVSHLVAGLWTKIGHATRVGDLVALTIAGLNLSLAAAGATVFCVYRGSGESLGSWTCGHQWIQHPQVGFGTVCAGMRLSFGMAWGIVVVEALVLANVMAGFLVVRRTALAVRGRKTESM